MLGIRLGVYWKFTWGFFIPISLTSILGYFFFTQFKRFESNGFAYPQSLVAIGWVLLAIGLLQLVIWGIYAIYKQDKTTFLGVSKISFIENFHRN